MDRLGTRRPDELQIRSVQGELCAGEARVLQGCPAEPSRAAPCLAWLAPHLRSRASRPRGWPRPPPRARPRPPSRRALGRVGCDDLHAVRDDDVGRQRDAADDEDREENRDDEQPSPEGPVAHLRPREEVAHASDRPDDLVVAVADLVAQVADEDLDDVAVGRMLTAPDLLEDLVAADDATGVGRRRTRAGRTPWR